MTPATDWTTDHVWYWRVTAWDSADGHTVSNQTFKYITDTRPPIFDDATQSVSPTSVTQGNPVTISIDVTSEYFFTEDNATGSPGNANATSSNLTFSATYSAGGGEAGGGGGAGGVIVTEKEVINITEITIEPGRIDTIFIFMPFDGMETWAEWQYVFTVSPLPASVMCSDPFTCGITPEKRINITYKPTTDDFITSEITGEVHITDVHDQIGHVKVTVTIINLAAYFPIYEFTSPHIPGIELFLKTEPITTTEGAAPVLYPLTIGGVEGDVSSNVKVTGIRIWWVALIGLFVGIYLGYMFLRGYY